MAALVPVFRYLSPNPEPDPLAEGGTVKVDKVSPDEIARPGTGKNGAYGARGVIVLRDRDGSLRAFDAKCSHAGCNVAFAGDKLFCHCHGGTYDLRGRNIAGPPPRPLVELRVQDTDGALYVSRLVASSESRG